MRKLLVLAVFFVTPALAQTAGGGPADYTIKLTLPELQTIGAALTKRPYEDVANLLANLNAQMNAQNKPPAAPPPAAEAPKP